MALPVKDGTRNQVIALLADSAVRMSQREIAELCGVSLSYVSKVWSELKPDLKRAHELLQEYQGHIRATLPTDDRARRLGELVRQDDQKMVSLKAIQYVDELDGIVTAKAKKETAGDDRPPSMFIFPAGSMPQIHVNSEQDSKSCAREDKVIDTEAVSSEDE